MFLYSRAGLERQARPESRSEKKRGQRGRQSSPNPGLLFHSGSRQFSLDTSRLIIIRHEKNHDYYRLNQGIRQGSRSKSGRVSWGHARGALTPLSQESISMLIHLAIANIQE
jgi:hypothetical protein